MTLVLRNTYLFAATSAFTNISVSVYILFISIYLPGKEMYPTSYLASCILSKELEMHVLFRKALFEKGIVAIYYTILIFSFCITCIVHKIEVRYVCMSEELFLIIFS